MRVPLVLATALLLGCGGASSVPQCEQGEYIEPGCGESDSVPFTEGCHTRCMPGQAGTACPTGGICTEVVSNPCPCGPGQDCCGACGQQDFLCL